MNKERNRIKKPKTKREIWNGKKDYIETKSETFENNRKERKFDGTKVRKQ